MLSDVKHLELMERLFHDTVEHLKRRLDAGEAEAGDEEFDEGAPPLLTEDSRQALRTEISLYRLCLDSVREQRFAAEDTTSDAIQHDREKFLRLMASAAQCEMRRDDHVLSVGFAAPSPHDRPQTDGEMFASIRLKAEQTLAALAGV